MIDRPRAAAELIIAARPAFVQAITEGETDHCVLFTRLAVDLARQRGIPARALPVTVELTGDRAPETAFVLGAEGAVPEGAPPDTWDGHLVAIFDRRLMVDLSIDSATSTELGIAPAPFVIDVPPEFIQGAEPVTVDVNRGRAVYMPRPDRRDYRDTVAWQPTPPDEVAKLADHILWHPENPM